MSHMLLKEVYDQDFLQKLTDVIAVHDAEFDVKNFLKISQKDFSALELKQRMRFISLRLHNFLNHKNYLEQIKLLTQIAEEIPKNKNSSLALIVLPDFIEMFGSVDFQASMKALEILTEFGSAEFAVRKFIKLDQKSALKFFAKWAKNKNFHVRRLASEGLRPRLPWGCALEEFKKNPTEIFPILEELKRDEAEYVRRSVANNLNDISKDHPHLVLNLLKKWQKDEVDERLIRHALRTLLKKGDKQALEIIGVKSDDEKLQNFSIQNFALQKAEIKNRVGSDGILEFGFALQNKAPQTKIRLEYAIHFLKKNGSHSRKIFQITTKNFAAGVFAFKKKHSFRDLTTRKHYAGRHLISLVVNGIEYQQLQFDLA